MPAMRNRVQGVQSRPPLSYGRGQGQARFRRQVYFGFSCAGHGHFRVNVRMRLSETRVLLSTWMSQKKRFRHAIVRRVPRNVRKQSHKKPLFLGHAGLHFPSGEVNLWVGIVTVRMLGLLVPNGYGAAVFSRSVVSAADGSETRAGSSVVSVKKSGAIKYRLAEKECRKVPFPSCFHPPEF